TGRVQIAHLSENTLGALNPDDMYLKLKQALDWFAALVALVALAPFFALIVLAIRCETTGPAIFRLKRMGYRGRVFTLYKFRTMRMESDIVTDDRERAITREDDARITRIGRFLRR